MISAYFVISGARLWFDVKQPGLYHNMGTFDIVWHFLYDPFPGLIIFKTEVSG